MESKARGSEEGTVRSFIASNFNAINCFGHKALRRLARVPVTGGAVALAVLWIALGAVQATAQSVQFFDAFQSYSQSMVQNAQGLVATAQGNLYVSGSHALGYIPVDVNGNPIVSGEHATDCYPSTGSVIGLAIDASNHIFRADLSSPLGGGAVEEFTLSGSPTDCTFSYIGSGWSAPSSVTVDSSSNLYVLDAGNGAIYELTPGSDYSKNEVCSSANLENTTGLSIDSSGNFYVASGDNYGAATLGSPAATAVYKVTGSGGGACTTTPIGSGWNSPSATAVDAAGNLWVVDFGAGTINLLTPNGGGFNAPMVYQSIPSIRTLMVNQAGRLNGFAYSTFATEEEYGNTDATVWAGGTPPHNLGTYNVGTSAPTVTVTVDLMSAANIGAYSVTTQGSSTGDFQRTGSTCATGSQAALYNCTVQVTFTPQAPGLRTGALVVADNNGQVLGTNYFYGVGLAPSVAYKPGTFAVDIPNSASINAPFGVAADEAGNLYVANNLANSISMYTSGSTSPTWSDNSLNGPDGMAVDAAGNIWVAECANQDVVLETLTGPATYAKSTVFSGSNGLNCPYDVAVDGSGNVYIADLGAGAVFKETPSNGSYIQSTVVSALSNPNGVAVDASGNIYIADTGNSQVLEETPSGSGFTQTIVANASSGGLSAPEGLAIDPNGNVYISDLSNGRIVVAAPSGGSFTQSTLLSTGMEHPVGLALDAAGDLFVADEEASVIDKLDVSTPPSFSFAATVIGNQSSDSPMTATLYNYGNEDLSISTIGIPAGFASDAATNCPLNTGTLAANATCLLGIDFMPTVAQSYSDNVQINDNNLYNSSASQPIAVSGTGGLAISPASGALPAGSVGAAYSQTFSASGGSGSYTYSLTGSLPAGLSLSAGGVLSGTPTTAGGATSFTVVATDISFAGSQESQAYTLSIGPGTPSVTAWPAAAAITYGQPLSASTLTGGAASVDGSFAFTAPATQPGAGSQSEGVTFTPNDTVDYNPVASTVTVTVNQATATVALGNLSQTYTGSPLSATATTTPSSLTVNLTYNGSSTAPTAAGSYTVVGTINDTNYQGTATDTLVIAKATASVSLGNLSQTYTGSPLSATATTTPSSLTVNLTYNGSSTAPTAAGSYTVVGTINDPNYIGSATATLVIGAAPSSVILSSSANPAALSSAVVLTATVTSNAGSPAGQVSFLDGTTPLGSAAIASGLATLTTSAMTTGAHSITAVYAGGASFSGSSSSALTLTIVDFSLSNGSAGDGSGGAGQSQTTPLGGVASYTIDLAPSTGTTFPSVMTLTITGLPSGATATLTTPGWTQQSPTLWTMPAGQPVGNLSLAIQAPAQLAAAATSRIAARGLPILALVFPLLPFACKWRGTGKRTKQWLSLVFVAMGMAALTGATGCGGSVTQPQTYTITATVSAGALSHSTQLILKVQ